MTDAMKREEQPCDNESRRWESVTSYSPGFQAINDKNVYGPLAQFDCGLAGRDD